MVMTQAAVFGLTEQRLAWLAQRQRIRAETVAAARATKGNAAAIDDDLGRVGDIEPAPELSARLYAKFMSLFRLGLGSNE